jgi:predicted membrane-bound spermidine synthase
MFGLGIGSIVGGFLSRRFPTRLPQLFFLAEILIGLFGLLSIPLIRYVGQKTQDLSIWGISLTTFSLLLIPTLLMGATLPILVAYFHRKYRHIGQSVGILYFFNTLGSALACILTVDLLFVLFGLPFTTTIAASFNFIVGYLVFRHIRQEPESNKDEDGQNGKKYSEDEFANAESLLEESA